MSVVRAGDPIQIAEGAKAQDHVSLVASAMSVWGQAKALGQLGKARTGSARSTSHRYLLSGAEGQGTGPAQPGAAELCWQLPLCPTALLAVSRQAEPIPVTAQSCKGSCGLICEMPLERPSSGPCLLQSYSGAQGRGVCSLGGAVAAVPALQSRRKTWSLAANVGWGGSESWSMLCPGLMG